MRACSSASSFCQIWLRGSDLDVIINRGGQKISPLEVEEVLLSHPAVLEAGVFAVPHDKLGENVAAVVVLRRRIPRRARTSCASSRRKRLAAYKVPSLIRSVAALPKGASGKVKRNALAALIAATQSGNEARAPRNALETQLAAIWAGLLELLQVGTDQDVFALGADLLAVTRRCARACANASTSTSRSRTFSIAPRWPRLPHGSRPPQAVTRLGCRPGVSGGGRCTAVIPAAADVSALAARSDALQL